MSPVGHYHPHLVLNFPKLTVLAYRFMLIFDSLQSSLAIMRVRNLQTWEILNTKLKNFHYTLQR